MKCYFPSLCFRNFSVRVLLSCQISRQGTHTCAAGSLCHLIGLFSHHRRSHHIEVDPLGSLFHKVFQETRCHTGTCTPARCIIGKIRADRPLDHLMIDRSHRQLPVIFSGLLRCFFPAAKRFPVIAKQRHHLISQGTLCRNTSGWQGRSRCAPPYAAQT